MLTTPQWLEEYSLEPVPPVDMKDIYIGEIEVKNPSLSTRQMNDAVPIYNISVYIEVDKYFEAG